MKSLITASFLVAAIGAPQAASAAILTVNNESVEFTSTSAGYLLDMDAAGTVSNGTVTLPTTLSMSCVQDTVLLEVDCSGNVTLGGNSASVNLHYNTSGYTWTTSAAPWLPLAFVHRMWGDEVVPEPDGLTQAEATQLAIDDCLRVAAGEESAYNLLEAAYIYVAMTGIWG